MPCAVENLHRHDRRVPRHAGDADAVVRRRGCNARDHCPVPFVVLRDSVVVDEVVAGKQLWSQVGVVEVDAGVDDRDLDRGRAPADVPGSGNPQRRQILLLGPKARIVRSRERVAGVVQLDGSDRRLGLEPLPDARGVRHFDERERCSVDERPGDPAVAGQRGFPLGYRCSGLELDEQALLIEPLTIRDAADRRRGRTRGGTPGRGTPTDDLQDQKSPGRKSDRPEPAACPLQLRTPSLFCAHVRVGKRNASIV